MGVCGANSQIISGHSDRITYCSDGAKIDPGRLEQALEDERAELRVDLATEADLRTAKIKASQAMTKGGVVNVGKSNLSKTEIQLLIEDGFASRQPTGYRFRLVVSEAHRSEAKKLYRG